MTLQEAIEARHSVRAYKELPLAEDVVKVLKRAQTEKGFLLDTIWAQRIWVYFFAERERILNLSQPFLKSQEIISVPLKDSSTNLNPDGILCSAPELSF